MKNAFMLLLAGTINVSAMDDAASHSQVVLLSVESDNNTTVGDVLREIEEMSEFYFTYNSSTVNTKRVVSIDIKDRKVNEILDVLFAGENIGYSINDKHIVLYRKDSNLLSKEQKNKKIVNGTVVDILGNPIIGANVMLKGTSNGTITDLDGKFKLEVSDGDILEVSYIGYLSQTIKVNGDNISVILKEDTQKLDEVVVVGYGTQKKVNLTGAVETVKSDKIQSKPVTTLQEALVGEAAGLTITQQSGQPGSGSIKMRVRGVGTWGNAEPLVLVDGIAMSINDVMPSDVESISVLKDAASAAIYGSRAANGVILITTKQGHKGKVSVSYTGNVGIQTPTRLPKMAESWQYAELYNQMMANDGKSSSLFPEDRIERMKKGGDPDCLEGSTDWYKELVDVALQHSHNISVQGGGENCTYIGSLGYTSQDGIIPSSYERYNARINTSAQITKWFKFGLNISYINDLKSESSGGASLAFFNTARALPYIPVKFSDGTWSFLSAPTNPVRMTTEDYGMHNVYGNKFSTLLMPELTFFENSLNIKGLFSYESNTYSDKEFQKTVLYESFEPAGQASNFFIPRNQQTDIWSQYNNMTASLTASFEKTLGKNNFKVLLGGSLESYKYKWTQASRKDFPNNDFSEINAGDPNTSYAAGNSTYSALASLYGRLNYNYDNRYLFEANLRYDGSSKFAKGNRWGLFPSFSGAWRISEEAFFDNIEDYVQNMKLRLSWGQLGNQQIDNYQFISTYGTGSSYMFGNSIFTGYREEVMGNPFITWETANNWNIGMDLSFFDTRLNASFDWYKRLTNDILLSLEAPALLGITPSMQNAGSVENKGWELNLNWHDNLTDDLSYSIGFNLSDVKNKVVDLKGYKSPTSNLTTRIEGEPLDALYGWETIGICTNQEMFDKYADLMKTYNPSWGIGDIIIKDLDGDGTITASDKKIIGNQIPRFCYGLNLGLNYKNFDFSCFFQGVGKVDGFNGRDVIEPLGIMSALEEHYTDSFDPQNPKSDVYYPKMSSNRYNYNNFSHWVQDASYLRLKNLQIGYTFKLRKYSIEKLRLSLSGQNLFTLTKFRVYDPESIMGVSYPNVAVYSFGLSVTL